MAKGDLRLVEKAVQDGAPELVGGRGHRYGADASGASEQVLRPEKRKTGRHIEPKPDAIRRMIGDEMPVDGMQFGRALNEAGRPPNLASPAEVERVNQQVDIAGRVCEALRRTQQAPPHTGAVQTMECRFQKRMNHRIR